MLEIGQIAFESWTRPCKGLYPAHCWLLVDARQSPISAKGQNARFSASLHAQRQATSFWTGRAVLARSGTTSPDGTTIAPSLQASLRRKPCRSIRYTTTHGLRIGASNARSPKAGLDLDHISTKFDFTARPPRYSDPYPAAATRCRRNRFRIEKNRRYFAVLRCDGREWCRFP
jgi:hypothetical protein